MSIDPHARKVLDDNGIHIVQAKYEKEIAVTVDPKAQIGFGNEKVSLDDVEKWLAEAAAASRGSVIFNNIKVDNSVVGTINTGNVQTIEVSLTYLHDAGNDQARDALKALTEAIVNDTSISATQKNELVEQITFLSEQTMVDADKRKPGLIKATLSALTQAGGTVSAMAGAWQAAEPILKSLFSP